MVTRDRKVAMPLPIQILDGTVVLSNRFGDGPFEDCQQFIQVRLPQGVEIEGIYNAASANSPCCCGSMCLDEPRDSKTGTN